MFNDSIPVIMEDIENKEETKKNTSIIPIGLVCPISGCIFLEPVKLIVDNGDDGAPVVEKDIADKLTCCPYTRRPITNKIRIREIESLVVDFLREHPECIAEQYSKPPVDISSSFGSPNLAGIREQEYAPTDIETTTVNSDVSSIGANTNVALVSQVGMFGPMMQNIARIGCQTVIGAGYSTLPAVIGSAIMDKAGYHAYNATEAAQCSAAGGALLGFITAMFCFVNQSCIVRSQEDRYDLFTKMSVIVVFAYGYGSVSEVLGSLLIGHEDMSIGQHAIAPAVGIAVLLGSLTMVLSCWEEHRQTVENEERRVLTV